MAGLPLVHHHIISEETAIAADLINIRNRIQNLRARFDLNDTYNYVGLNGAELLETFPHLTQSEIGNGFATFDAVVTELGDPVQGPLAALYLLNP